MSTGSCPNGIGGAFPPFAYSDGPVEVGSGVAGGTGGDPGACGILFFSTNGKTIMQNLNDRLASYIDKVRCLEAENVALESNISDFYAKQGQAGEPKDYSHFCHEIEELKNQVICTTAENNKILLKIDNNCMNLEEMRQKFETESAIRGNVEADLNGLHPVLHELSSCKGELEAELESLQEELCGLKKSHEEELICLKKQSSDVNMEVSSCPGPDLKKILEELRCKYESMIDANRQEVAHWYEGKLEEVNQEVCSCSQEVEDGNHKIIDLKRQVQAIEIDLQAQCNLRDSLQVYLTEAEGLYHVQLAETQDQIYCMEQRLAELRLETEAQDQEYKELLDVKNRLEQEIKTYRSLLEEGPQDLNKSSLDLLFLFTIATRLSPASCMGPSNSGGEKKEQ
ncbi:keratin, type I cytoskeletal 17-like [Elgaria multicarinata webbii]|uniref:keratin, type I cytoskeletal 17-like n=1 Tax=Elgaria multicarinata webbii TaxID=159646 RepID=UPI002FCCE1DB